MSTAKTESGVIEFDFKPFENKPGENLGYVFVSLSSHDVDKISPILNHLVKNNVRIWYANQSVIAGGCHFNDVIAERIKNCSCALLFVSRSSVKSKYVGFEIINAQKYNIPIIPINIEDKTPNDDSSSGLIPDVFGMIFEDVQEIDCSNDRKQNYDVILKSIPEDAKKTMLYSEDGKVLERCQDTLACVTLDDCVETIGEGAFAQNEKLTQLPDFRNVTKIGIGAFRGCVGLKEIIIPKTIEYVGDSAFRDCSGVTKIKICDCQTILGERVFENCSNVVEIELPEGMVEIYNGVFNSCKKLVTVKLPSTLKVLSENAFADCINLENIVLPDRLSKIEVAAFNGCSKLKNIKLNNSLTKAAKYSFKDCKCIEKFNIPATMDIIVPGAFRGCDNLKEFEVDKKNKSYKSFATVLYDKCKSLLVCYPPQKEGSFFSIPDSVQVIGEWAFCGAKNLKEVEIPDVVWHIAEGAFHSCAGLTKIVIPDSVIRIDDMAFRHDENLVEVHIPDSVIKMGWGIFYLCSDDLVVYCSNNSVAAKYCDEYGIKHMEEN